MRSGHPAPPRRSSVGDYVAVHLLLVPAAIAVLASSLASSGVDLAIAQWFFDPASVSFPWRGSFWLELLGHQVARAVPIALGTVALAGGLVGFALPYPSRWRTILLAVGAATIAAPVIVAALRAMAGQHCPADLQIFGGLVPLDSPSRGGWWASSREQAGHCLPSGHAAGGYAVLALYFAGWAAGTRRARWGGLVAGIACGVVFSAVRIAQGASFASATVWSAFVDWFVCAIVFLPILSRADEASTPGNPARASSALRGPIRCCFLFNHDELHQMAHSAPIAFELMRRCEGVRVSLVATTPPQLDRLERWLARFGLPADDLHLIGLPRWLGGAAWMLDPLVPFSRVATLLCNRRLFARMDVLVVPEKTSLVLRAVGGLGHLKFVHTRHGAGDREVGFDRHSGKFDLVLMSGAKIRDRLFDAGLLEPGGCAIVGYPKFDLCLALAKRPRLFDNDRPTVLYNPHCSPRLSSWFRDGLDVLEAFYRCGRYNLVFAPHVMLFRKRVQISLEPLRLAGPGRIPRRFLDCPHILVDLGSERSTDMTYTEAADCYLGDVSSQIYEFLRRPRPCAFIDAHRSEWRDDPNYRHWLSGPVLEDAGDLIAAIDAAFASHADYMPAQRELFEYSIDLREMTSSKRAAEAILAFVARAVPQPAKAPSERWDTATN